MNYPKELMKTAHKVVVEDGYEILKVPPWAIKPVLQHEDIIEGGAEL